jgi:hypothetical protein
MHALAKRDPVRKTEQGRWGSSRPRAPPALSNSSPFFRLMRIWRREAALIRIQLTASPPAEPEASREFAGTVPFSLHRATTGATRLYEAFEPFDGAA